MQFTVFKFHSPHGGRETPRKRPWGENLVRSRPLGVQWLKGSNPMVNARHPHCAYLLELLHRVDDPRVLNAGFPQQAT